ncbi:MAG: hypothetical protein LHW60_07920 [Candidatus Cloacimonetes bacterium]|nr:hypothetical protein [Candidatus Cloacimonadota bacterium]
MKKLDLETAKIIMDLSLTIMKNSCANKKHSFRKAHYKGAHSFANFKHSTGLIKENNRSS